MNVLRESPWYQEIGQRGEQRGIQIGKQEGIQIGKQEGIQIGIQQVAQNLLATGMDPDQVAMVTGLSLDWIQSLQANA
jgi:predicted transposase/invertase (TIGR01784 family)